MQGNERKRQSWVMLLFMAMVVPLWVMMFMMFLHPKKQQAGQQQPQKTFPSLKEIKQVPDIKQAILSWKEQVEANPKAPDADLTLLKVAIAYENVLDPPDYGAAYRAYQTLAESYKRSPFAVHALFHAGQLAEQKLHDQQLAVSSYEKLSRRTLGAREEMVVWDASNGEFAPDLHGQVLIKEVQRRLDGYYRDKPLYKALETLVRICGNDRRYSYGLALVLTAVLVQGFLFLLPFTRKQYESMRKMQEMQPEMKKIQETFKTDPRRMQQEIFSLYKRQHFNPMTGCFLGMLIQIPFLWGVFAAIRHFQYPLANASFIWIKSLSQPDMPLLVLYCGSMYLTTRYGPGSVSDPSQAQQQKTMSWLMPIMFLFFFRTWPSGFLLYWLATNVLSMGQRYLIMRKRTQQVGLPPTLGRPVEVPALLPQNETNRTEDETGEEFMPQEESPDLSEPEVVAVSPLASAATPGVPIFRGTRRGGKKRRRKPIAEEKRR